ncbi:MAG: hypothetical protein IPL53_15365 [Ignavibacteria bacterium]|nr:hypothetical protein [Ignavibacteria bacterium]
MIKKYFIYEDNLRTIVSIITGILIAGFNLFSGFLISVILIEMIFNKNEASPVIFVLFSFIPTVFFAAVLLLIILRILGFILNGIKIENYSYIRLVLLFSLVINLFLIISYLLFSLILAITRALEA